MSEWVDSTVAGVTEYQRAGGTPLATVPKYYGGEISFVTIEDITRSGRYLDRTERNLSAEGLKGSAAWLLKGEHVLYSMYATIGKPIINRISCATNQAIIALKPNENIDLKFLYYQLLFIRPDVYKYTAQTTQSNLNARVVREIPIRYPRSRADQARIVEVLDCMEDAIERTEALIEKHQQIKAGMMHDLFTRGAVGSGQLRQRSSELPELFQETALGSLPREWRHSTVGESFEIDSGITLGPHRRPERRPRRYLRVANVHRDQLRLDDVASIETLPGDDRYVLLEGDLLVVEGHANPAEIGRCAMVDQDAAGMFFQNHLFRMRAIGIDRDFALLWLNSFHVQRYWERTCSTSSGLHTINRRMLKAVPIFVPSQAEQRRIVSAAASARAVLEGHIKVLAKLRTQKLGLMQDLLTGRVVVKVPEPAFAA